MTKYTENKHFLIYWTHYISFILYKCYFLSLIFIVMLHHYIQRHLKSQEKPLTNIPPFNRFTSHGSYYLRGFESVAMNIIAGLFIGRPRGYENAGKDLHNRKKMAKDSGLKLYWLVESWHQRYYITDSDYSINDWWMICKGLSNGAGRARDTMNRVTLGKHKKSALQHSRIILISPWIRDLKFHFEPIWFLALMDLRNKIHK